MLDLVIFNEPEDIPPHLLHILSVQGQVIESGVKVFVQSLRGPSPGGGPADDIGVELLVVLLQIGEFGGLGISCHVIGPPAQDLVAEHPEGVHDQVEQHPARQTGRRQRSQHNARRFQRAGPPPPSLIRHWCLPLMSKYWYPSSRHNLQESCHFTMPLFFCQSEERRRGRKQTESGGGAGFGSAAAYFARNGE